MEITADKIISYRSKVARSENHLFINRQTLFAFLLR